MCLFLPIQPIFSATGPRGTHLWEFIRDILLNPERNPGLIKWEDRTEGIFRFLKSEAVAQLWGKKKNNTSMTYEKLSRAMRYNSTIHAVTLKKKKKKTYNCVVLNPIHLLCSCHREEHTVTTKKFALK